jgi:hypothetical protein
MPSTVNQLLLAKGVKLSSEELFARLVAICSAIVPRADRNACMLGVGQHAYLTTSADMRAIHDVCGLFNREDELLCERGVLWEFFEYERQNDALLYCQLATDDYAKRECYEEVFRLAQDPNVSEKKTWPRCGPDELMCLEAQREQ